MVSLCNCPLVRLLSLKSKLPLGLINKLYTGNEYVIGPTLLFLQIRVIFFIVGN